MVSLLMLCSRRQGGIALLGSLAVLVAAVTVTLDRAQASALDDLKGKAAWRAARLDLVIDLTKPNPIYEGTMVLQSDKATDGPILILNNRSASMKMLALEVKAPSDLIDGTSIELNVPHPGGRAATLHAVHFTAPTKHREIEIAFRYEFLAEQGQVLQRDSLSYASWVTAWYPSPIAPTEALISPDTLSIPGETSFVLPNGWSALSNGNYDVEQQRDGRLIQRWLVGTGIARSYVAAPFKVTSTTRKGKEIRIYTLKTDSQAASTMSTRYADIIDLLQARFGPYPYETFALAEIPDKTTDYFGASSEQGFIVAESKNFVGDAGLPLFAHEAAHSWWGNSFSCAGKGASLCSEALAQMGAILAVEHVHGQAALRDFMDVSTPEFTNYASARGYFSLWRSGADLPISEVEDDWRVHRLMDSKGMWFWQMLRLEMGDEAFFSALRVLSADRRHPTLEELKNFFVERGGGKLGGFFDQWLNRAGAPILSMKWENPIAKTRWDAFDLEVEGLVTGEPEGPIVVNVSLKQEQQDIYALNVPIEFRFYYGPSVTTVVKLDEREKTVSFSFDRNLKDVLLDPMHRVLIWRSAYGPKPETQRGSD